jgi:hypothetical protein
MQQQHQQQQQPTQETPSLSQWVLQLTNVDQVSKYKYLFLF